MRPIGVPGPVCVSRSFCSFLSMDKLPGFVHAAHCSCNAPNAITHAPAITRRNQARSTSCNAARMNSAGPRTFRAGNALRWRAGDLVLAVFNVDGEFFVTDDHCTHGPGSLSEGYIEGDVVECNFHNGQFNIRTGEVVSPPCMVPIKTYPAVVEDGKVFIEV